MVCYLKKLKITNANKNDFLLFFFNFAFESTYAHVVLSTNATGIVYLSVLFLLVYAKKVFSFLLYVNLHFYAKLNFKYLQLKSVSY